MKDLASLEAELASAILSEELPREFEGLRVAVYRRLVHATLDDVIRKILPRTAARGGDAFWRSVRRFYAERGPKTHYLRDVPGEFVTWAAGRWTEPQFPAYLHDLARHETIALEVGACPSIGSPSVDAELSLDGRAVFDESARLVTYRFAVHELPDDEDDRTVPPKRATRLLVYRDREHELRWLDLTPAAAAILGDLLAGERLDHAITNGAARANVPVDEALLTGTARLLADLADRGVLLGGTREA